MLYQKYDDENGIFKCVVFNSDAISERIRQLVRQNVPPVEASAIAHKELCITKEIPHKKLKLCPHCGGTAKVEGKSVFNLLGVLIKCSKCGCGTRYKFEGSPCLSELGGYVSLEKAVAKVVDLWNCRHKKGECEQG